MGSTIGFLIVRKLLRLLGIGPTADDKDVEIAVLRHQLAGNQTPGRTTPLLPH